MIINVPLIQQDKKFEKVRNRYVPSPTRPIFIVKVHRKRITKGDVQTVHEHFIPQNIQIVEIACI